MQLLSFRSFSTVCSKTGNGISSTWCVIVAELVIVLSVPFQHVEENARIYVDDQLLE